MALTPLEALMIVIQDEIPKLDYFQYPLLQLLTKEDEFQETVTWNVNVGGSTTGGRATNAVNAISSEESDMTNAALPIGLRTMGARIDKVVTKIVQARRTGPGPLKALLAYDMKDKMERLFTDLNALVYSGDGSTASHGLYGLSYASDPANAVYAGISSDTYPLWSPTRLDNAGTPRNLTPTLLKTMHRTLMGIGGNYDVIMASHAMIQKYDELFTDGSQVNTTPMGYADLGFTGYSFMGRPLLADTGCPAGEMHFINTRGVRLKTFNLAGSTENSVQSDSTKTMGINLKLGEIRNENPDVLSWELGVKPQLQVTNRRHNAAAIVDLNE